MELSTIEAILGQREAFENITKNINSYNSFLIRGETGYGKSYLLNKIEKYICSIRKTVSLKLTPQVVSYDYAPFLSAISKIESTIINTGTEIVRNFSDMIPIFGEMLEKTLSIEFQYPSEFSDVESNIISQIKMASQGADVVLLCDEISSWDEPSIILLSKIIRYYDKLGHLRLSCVCADSNLSTEFNSLFAQVFELRPLAKENSFEIVKTVYPNTDLDDEDIMNICSLCKYNIGIVKTIISSIDASSVFSDREIRSVIISSISKQENVTLLLDKASVIGFSSYKKLLQKYVSYSEFDFQYAVSEAKEEKLVLEDKEHVVFANETIWSIFNNFNKGNKKYHFELAECIESILPTNHKRIGGEYILAGMTEKAAVQYALSAIYYYITYRIKPIYSEQEKETMDTYGLLDFCNKIIQLYEDYFTGNFHEDINYPSSDYDELNFEIDYAKAFVCINTEIEYAYYKNSLIKLKRWIDNISFRDKFPEQWLRAAFLYLGTGVELHMEYDKELLIDIQNRVEKYRKTDKNILNLYYDFNSKCNSIYSVDIAANVTFEAVRYWENQNSYKYLIALNNALANAIVLGRKSQALEYSKKAIEYINRKNPYPNYFFGPLGNNLLLSVLLWDTKIFSTLFGKIENYMIMLIDNNQKKISKVLYKNNLAIFHLYCMNIDEAEKILSELYQLVEYNEEIDDYYSYLIKNNYFLLRLLKYKDVDVRGFLSELSKLKPLDLDMKYFTARLKYLEANLTQDFNLDISCDNWNDFNKVQVGEAWFFWGKWFLLSDIQFWSE